MPFTISLGTIINFVLGMVTGMILFSAIYVYFFVRGKNIKIDEIKHPTVDVKEDELKAMIPVSYTHLTLPTKRIV